MIYYLVFIIMWTLGVYIYVDEKYNDVTQFNDKILVLKEHIDNKEKKKNISILKDQIEFTTLSERQKLFFVQELKLMKHNTKTNMRYNILNVEQNCTTL